jgi:ABC-type taurine transport system substrate-binding protein
MVKEDKIDKVTLITKEEKKAISDAALSAKAVPEPVALQEETDDYSRYLNQEFVRDAARASL